jgi:tetratricopeptide (TPR) repeat protein
LNGKVGRVVDRTQTVLDGDSQSVRTRVFLSYSRKDGSFTNRLATELLGRGYAPDFDQSAFDSSNIEFGMSAQDEWWQRLQQMIEAADVIVFVVSPDSAASKVCDEEIVHARNLGKRIIPILCRPIDFAKAPARLAALNVKISFIENGGDTFSPALDRLCAELDVNVNWHREQRRLVQLAVKWSTESRSTDQLMNSADIEASERILKNRPRDADPPGQILLDFLHASRAAQEERIRKEQEQVARTRRFQNSARLVSNNLVGELAEQFHEREGVPLALTDSILETAVHFLDGLSEGGISNPGMERERGLALAQLSEKKRLLNDFDQARSAAQRALEIFERLSKSDPENVQYLDDLHVALDRLIDASGPDIALGAADRALGLAKTLVGKNPTLKRRLHYSIFLSKYAYLIKSSDKPRAIAMYTEALRIQDNILRENESLEYARRAAALTQLNIGQLYCEASEFPAARTWVLASLTEIRRLKADHPHSITYIQDEAAAREVLGDILRHGPSMDEALAEYLESLTLTERLNNSDNSNIELRLTLLRAYDRVAVAVAHLGFGEEAVGLYTKGLRMALELGRASPERNDWPGTRSLLESLSMSLIKRKEPEIAYQYTNETLELLRDLVPRNSKFKDDLAKVLGLQSYVAQFTKQFRVSIDASAEAIALSPTNWRIGVNRIHALLREGNGSEAAQYYRKIREHDSSGGRKIAKEIENDLDAFKSAHLPEDFLLALDKFVNWMRDGF